MAQNDWYDAANNRYIDEATGLVDPNPSGATIAGARPDANLSGYSHIPNTDASSDPAALQQQYGVAPVKDAAGLYQLPDSVLNKYQGSTAGDKIAKATLGAIFAGVGGIGLGAGLGGAAGGVEAAAAAPSAFTAEAFSPVATGLGDWSVGTNALLGMTPGEIGAIEGAFPLTSSTAAGAGGMLVNPGYNFLDPSTYGGGAGNTPLNVPGGADPGVGGATGPQYIPAINTLSPVGSFGENFGISMPAAAGGGGPVVPGFNALDPTTFSGAGGAASGGTGFAGATDLVTNAATSTAEEVLKKIKEGGGNAMDWIAKNPSSAAMLGLSAANALSKPKLPEAAQSVQKANTPNLASASGVVNSGGSTGPAWNTQKAAIDSAIDRQIAEKKQQILQQAQNSGMGVDSLVTVQQIQKMQEQMEGLRQQQYMQAQQQNVQAALSEMGMSNQALGQVAGQQFASSKEAQSSAAQTAQLALMLQQMQKTTANQGAAPNA